MGLMMTIRHIPHIPWFDHGKNCHMIWPGIKSLGPKKQQLQSNWFNTKMSTRCGSQAVHTVWPCLSHAVEKHRLSDIWDGLFHVRPASLVQWWWECLVVGTVYEPALADHGFVMILKYIRWIFCISSSFGALYCEPKNPRMPLIQFLSCLRPSKYVGTTTMTLAVSYSILVGLDFCAFLRCLCGYFQSNACKALRGVSLVMKEKGWFVCLAMEDRMGMNPT